MALKCKVYYDNILLNDNCDIDEATSIMVTYCRAKGYDWSSETYKNRFTVKAHSIDEEKTNDK